MEKIMVENSQSSCDNRLGDSSTSSNNKDSDGVTNNMYATERRGEVLLPTEEALWLPPNSLKDTASSSGNGMGEHGNGGFYSKRTEKQPEKANDSDNMVTASATSTASSECQDTRNEDKVLPISSNRDGPPPRKKVRYHQQVNHHQRSSCSYSAAASIKSQPLNDDVSTLQVPADDGSDRIVAGDVEGGVPRKSATIVASRLLTSSAVSSLSGSKHRSSPETSGQNQHYLFLPPHREPRYHTIRNTFYRSHGSDSDGNSKKHSHRSNRSSSRSAQNGKPKRNREQSRSKRSQAARTTTNTGLMKSKNSTLPSSKFSMLQEGNARGSSSGSGTDGTEDGYAGSISSNESGSGNQERGSSSPSPSETSSEECERQGGRHEVKRHRHTTKSKQKSSRGTQGESSSEIADFGSSGSSETMDEEDVGNRRRGGDAQSLGMKTTYSSSPSLSSSNYSEDSDGGLQMAYLSAKRDADAEHERMLKKTKDAAMSGSMTKSLASRATSNRRLTFKELKVRDGRPPVLAMGCDVMAHILTFLHPPEILDILTMPLSKSWRRNYTSQPELWRVLCLVEPFKAIMDGPNFSSGDVKTGKNTEKLLDKYRLLYTSFVRCMKYVSQIRDDAVNGRPPAYIDYGIAGAVRRAPDMHSVAKVNKTTKRGPRGSSGPPPPTTLGSNRNLQNFLAQAMDVVLNSSNNDGTKDEGGRRIFPSLLTAARVGTAHVKNETIQKMKSGPKFGRSMITSRLYSPVEGKEPSNLNLPWSCAIYSIVNWMVAFSDVEGIQTLCLQVLPVLLENEQHRLTAQHAGLADVVLRAMVMFSESAQLHIAAFHTIVLLARPHGGKEGMMFRTSMTAGGIFRGIYQRHGKSGIAVMLDSMRRFQDNSALLAMSCWALVNIALVSDQKAVLVKLGGIQAITNAMYRHPYCAELQFRALFALINLVIPSVEKSGNNGERAGVVAASPTSDPEQLGELNETTEKEIIDELVGDVASLVVHVMKNFCSSEAILNRACLVLHNLSLTDDYHVILLWTPQCYQMLEWCVANFRSDQVLQQSATGTLHRLQSTLAADEELRLRFTKSLQTQQQNVTLKRARHEVR